MQAVSDRLAMKVPRKTIARELHTSVESINAAFGGSEVSAPYEQRSAEKLAAVADEVLESYQSDLKAGKVSPNSKPIHYGIFCDKRHDFLAAPVGKSPEQDGCSIQSILDDLRSVRPLQVNVQVNVGTPQPAK